MTISYARVSRCYKYDIQQLLNYFQISKYYGISQM